MKTAIALLGVMSFGLSAMHQAVSNEDVELCKVTAVFKNEAPQNVYIDHIWDGMLANGETKVLSQIITSKRSNLYTVLGSQENKLLQGRSWQIHRSNVNIVAALFITLYKKPSPNKFIFDTQFAIRRGENDFDNTMTETEIDITEKMENISITVTLAGDNFEKSTATIIKHDAPSLKTLAAQKIKGTEDEHKDKVPEEVREYIKNIQSRL